MATLAYMFVYDTLVSSYSEIHTHTHTHTHGPRVKRPFFIFHDQQQLNEFVAVDIVIVVHTTSK